MPNLDEHCRNTLKRYNIEGRDIHSWIDDPCKKYSGSHRQFRHDTETVKLVGNLFGKTYGITLAENVALDHIMLDHDEDIKKRTTTKEIPEIRCSCNTLLKSNHQSCPNCGANRTEIIDSINRTYELEKLKAQQKKKDLRKELKIELEFSEMTPMRRMEAYFRFMNAPAPFVDVERVLKRMVENDMQTHPEHGKKSFT